jgi:hypothetical protein
MTDHVMNCPVPTTAGVETGEMQMKIYARIKTAARSLLLAKVAQLSRDFKSAQGPFASSKAVTKSFEASKAPIGNEKNR